ncbi:class I SAM-dependent methyltransferase [Ktedonobacter racemifer]|uniref:Methyltransferase type 11 n=1 Tax=Ktedonobacter racemifer DSM 44963 TaxID=485913 RepID=D6U1F1_KTERA|nr:class I SAM-dependent methyltransferase [Ktedonobacter racemifer]EFH80802.1 Methyltransferase type 11 [Ktedonobacter racemifer DSM 44963]
MTRASYNDIAQWYDQFLRERPVYMEVILPGLLTLVGEVEGEVICDLACGQGWVARELARRGAQVIGLDLAPNLLALAQRYEEQEPLGIGYVQGDAQRAEGLSDHQFTGCVCVMALINIPDLQATFQSVRRILKPGGWLVFAIPHPCFESPHAQWTSLSDPEHPLGRTVTGYFDERQWFSSNPDGVRSRVGDYHRMLSTYLNQLAAAGFALERTLEPGPSDRQAERVPGNREIPTLLLIRAHLSDGPQAENISRG